MGFMSLIIEALSSVSSWFYGLYLDCYYAGWPLSGIASWFYSLCTVFNNLAWQFYYFSVWVSDVASKLPNILSWDAIWNYIVQYAQPLLDVLKRLAAWWNSIWSEVETWWSATQGTVQGWISATVQPFNSMLTAWNNFWQTTWPQWVSSFGSLKSAWDNFWLSTLPTLVSFSWLGTWWNSKLLEVQGLLSSAFTLRESLWAGWQDWKGKVTEFFTDPEDWLYKAVDRIIERFW